MPDTKIRSLSKSSVGSIGGDGSVDARVRMKSDSTPGQRSPLRNFFRRLIFFLFTVNTTGFICMAVLLLIIEAVLSLEIVWLVPYTEIDWSTYMQQVKCYLKGERNYTRIEGDTGPIVYPAGHLAIYRFLYIWTDKGQNVRMAQYFFVGFYLLNLILVFRLFFKSRRIAPFVLALICLSSYRIHSIFMLRLFNDPIAMLTFFAAANLWLSQHWFLGCVCYSLAVSVKMNVLLFAPAVFFVLLLSNRSQATVCLLGVCAFVQVVIAWEFLLYDPISYMKKAFELNRVFLFKWTVNFRFLPEHIFLNKWFHVALLFGHISLVGLFMCKMWFRSQGGLSSLLTRLSYGIKTRLDAHEILYALFTANLIGIAFARSLHYQFYSWYYHSLSYLLFSSIFPTVGANDEEKAWNRSFFSVVPVYSEFSEFDFFEIKRFHDNLGIVLRIAILLAVEYCWNVYPSTVFSSSLLHFLHFTILALLVWNRQKGLPPRNKKIN